MIQVSKDEAKMLRKRFPFLRLTRTVHKYYVDEIPKVINYLRNGCGRRVTHNA